MVMATAAEVLHTLLVLLAERPSHHMEDEGRFKFNRRRGDHCYEGWLAEASVKRDMLLTDLLMMKICCGASIFKPFEGKGFNTHDVIKMTYKFNGLGLEFLVEYVNEANELKLYRTIVPVLVLNSGKASMRDELEGVFG